MGVWFYDRNQQTPMDTIMKKLVIASIDEKYIKAKQNRYKACLGTTI